MTAIKVYRDNDANAVVIAPASVATQFTNTLHAVKRDDDLIDVWDLYRVPNTGNLKHLSCIAHTDFRDRDGNAIPGTVDDVVNYLNTQFTAFAGGSGGTVPVITSPTTAASTVGNPFNYQITATNQPIFFSASGLPDGLTCNQATGLIFGSPTADGVFAVNIAAMNINGTGADTLTLTVHAAGPAWRDTYSVRFRDHVYQQYLSVASTASIQRAGNEAWSIAFWLHLEDTLRTSDFYARGESANNHIYVGLTAAGAVKVRFKQSTTKALEVTGGTLALNTWYLVVVTNDGSETPAGVKIYVDGVVQVTTTVQNNLTGHVTPGNTTRIGRAAGNTRDANWFDGCINEMSFWDIALSPAQVTTLWGAGVPFDLSGIGFLANLMAWWRMGDVGDAYPNLWDHIGANHATMMNMTGLNLVSHTP